jgi:teichuronic acid biosynthesis glycosyltransferase TuaC
MRVLYVIPGKAEGCTFIFSRRQIACMESSGVKTRSFFLVSRTSIPILIAEYRRLRREIKSFLPDIIHAQFGTMSAMICACASTRPLVITFRGSDLNPSVDIGPLRSWLGRLLSQLAALRAQYTICVAAQLKATLWWRQSRAEVIPNGVNLSLFAPLPIAEARSRLGWKAEERVVLFNAGASAEVKRLDLAEAAVEKARLSVSPIRFEVLRGQVPPEDVPLYMNASDCLLVTSDWEGSPDIIKEALACNLPVVSVDVGDAAERVADVVPSHIVGRSPEVLGRCIAEVLEENRRSNGRDKITHLSDQSVTERIRDIYDQVIREVQGSAAIMRHPHAAGPTQNP